MGLKKPLFSTGAEFGINKVVETLKNLEKQFGYFYKPDEYLLSIQKT
jgi:hypothetical protein